MRFTKAAKPFVTDLLKKYDNAIMCDEHQQAFSLLEDAHVIGQQSTYLHCLVHFKMLQHGFKHQCYKEVGGQAFRLLGAATKTAFGLVPMGNTGGANVSPFARMPISESNSMILKKISSITTTVTDKNL